MVITAEAEKSASTMVYIHSSEIISLQSASVENSAAQYKGATQYQGHGGRGQGQIQQSR